MTQTPWIHAPTEDLNRPTMHQEMHCALSKLESNKADKRELLQAKRLKGFWKSRQGDHHKSSDKLHSIHKETSYKQGLPEERKQANHFLKILTYRYMRDCL